MESLFFDADCNKKKKREGRVTWDSSEQLSNPGTCDISVTRRHGLGIWSIEH